MNGWFAGIVIQKMKPGYKTAGVKSSPSERKKMTTSLSEHEIRLPGYPVSPGNELVVDPAMGRCVLVQNVTYSISLSISTKIALQKRSPWASHNPEAIEKVSIDSSYTTVA